MPCCFQYDKDSKMKANHNQEHTMNNNEYVVSSTTKIVKWKQITTAEAEVFPRPGCFQYDKDSKMKANHNATLLTGSLVMLFPVRQR